MRMTEWSETRLNKTHWSRREFFESLWCSWCPVLSTSSNLWWALMSCSLHGVSFAIEIERRFMLSFSSSFQALRESWLYHTDTEETNHLVDWRLCSQRNRGTVLSWTTGQGIILTQRRSLLEDSIRVEYGKSKSSSNWCKINGLIKC